jgi:pimeloyl-ACP methyl ester carboxylesterase
MKIVKTLISLYCFLYLTACSIVVKEDMVVSPSKEINNANLEHLKSKSGYKEVNLFTENNLKIYGLEKINDNKVITILVLHGNALNLSLQPWFGVLDSISALDVNILAIDYQGFGYSEGTASFSSMNQNARTALDSIPKGQSVFVYGLSLGSVMAAELAKDERIKGIIIEGGITNEKEMIELYQSRNIFGSLVTIELGAKLKFDNVSIIENIDKPILVIHGDEDTNIPISMGKRIHKASKNKFSEFYLVEGGGHCDTFRKDKENYLNKIGAFINSQH